MCVGGRGEGTNSVLLKKTPCRAGNPIESHKRCILAKYARKPTKCIKSP